MTLPVQDREKEAALLRDAMARLVVAQRAVRDRLAMTGWSAEAHLLDMRIGVAITDMLAVLDGTMRHRDEGDASGLEQKDGGRFRSGRNGPKHR